MTKIWTILQLKSCAKFNQERFLYIKVSKLYFEQLTLINMYIGEIRSEIRGLFSTTFSNENDNWIPGIWTRQTKRPDLRIQNKIRKSSIVHVLWWIFFSQVLALHQQRGSFGDFPGYDNRGRYQEYAWIEPVTFCKLAGQLPHKWGLPGPGWDSNS